MSDLVCDCNCDLDLDMDRFPNSCGAINYGHPKLLLFQKPEGELTLCTGDAPILAHIQAALTVVGDNHMILLGPITNGVRVESERQEESGADTIDGMTDVISQTIQITGKLKFLDEAVRTDLENLNCYDRLSMWIITTTGWIFGGCDGYNVANFISTLLMEGFGTRAHIPLDYKFQIPCHDPANQDDGFVLLRNEA